MVSGLWKNVAELPQRFRLVDGLDIVIIAVLLYGGLLWFKRTTNRSVVILLTALAGLYFVARALDMYLTTLVFHAAFAALLVVLVVIFQDEIRRLFDRVAAWGLHQVHHQARPAILDETDSIVEAVFAMASSRTGALIVIKGREPLERHINGGVPLSGKLSRPVLYSIFDPNSAGHDGAVVIDGEKIELFGAHLPISKNHKEIKGRGTRHSAALGLAELTDALTIVVSEERGVVSVAENSRLVEVPAAELASNLTRFLSNRYTKKDPLSWHVKLLRDAHLKAAAIALAVVGWFLISFQVDEVQSSIVIPIEYRNVPDYAEIDSTTPADALVTLVGTERAFRQLDRRVLKISLDLSQLRSGTEFLEIQHDDVRRPPNLTVHKVQPGRIRIQLNMPKDENTESD